VPGQTLLKACYTLFRDHHQLIPGLEGGRARGCCCGGPPDFGRTLLPGAAPSAVADHLADEGRASPDGGHLVHDRA
jgi:hypothetical protein